MESLEKKERLNELYDYYGALLTDKQQAYFEYYYREDYSLQEIAEVFHVTRNAVYDHLKKAEDHLVFYETHLKLKEKNQKREELYHQLENKIDEKWLEELRKLDE